MRGKLHGKRSYTKQHDDSKCPSPFGSISSALFLVLTLSTLSALYVGARRGSHRVILIDNVPNPLSVDTKNDGDQIQSLSNNGKNDGPPPPPSIRSLQDLKQSEIHPEAGPKRHIVTPPKDELPVSLVTCTTTAGYLHILVHPSWAPLGAGRFLQMVNTQYFSSKVALMRCVKGFLCQFGIAGITSYNQPYRGKKNILPDDPNWLPEGPEHRTNKLGVKRFGKGYLAYAGGGKNSRSNQLIVALKDNERLGGGSPWEVPWGEVVGSESFHTLDTIYTGYGEKGPSQGRLNKEGSSEEIKKDFPKLDYILGCELIDSTS